MGKASISIAVTGSYNGSAITKAQSALDTLSVKCAAASETAASSWATAGSELAETGGEIYNLGESLESFGSALTKSVTLPMLAVAAASVSAAVDIDDSLTSVRKTVDATEEEYDELKEAAIEASTTSAVSASELLDLEALGAQLGFNVDELSEFAEVASGLDIATDMDADTAATEMAQFANITGMAHDEIENYASAIVEVGNNMATTESEVSSMAQRVAAASTQIGMSEDEIIGWSAAMSSMGIEAEAGGTAFSTVISNIDKAVATGSSALETYAEVAGMSAEDFSTAWEESASDTFVALLNGVEGAENMSVALEEMGISSTRQTDMMKRLASNTDLVTEALGYAEEGWEENTALSDEVANRNASLSSQFEMLSNKVTAVAEDVGTPLCSALVAVIDAAEPLITAITEVTQGFADMDSEDQRAILGLAGMAAAAGPVITVVGKLTKGVGNAYTAVGKAEQGWATYADAMTTTNAASLKAYSSNDKLAKALEKNPAAAAAGGVDEYVAAVKDANKADTTYNKAVKALTKEQNKGTKANQERVDALTEEVERARESKDAADAQLDAYKDAAKGADANTASVKAQSVAMSAAASVSSTLKTALAAIGPALVLTAATAAIGSLVTVIQKARTHASDLEKATSGLESASRDAGSAIDEETSILDIFNGTASDSKVDIDGLLEAQAELADTIAETNASATAESAQLQDAYSVIQEYANQSDLSAEAQSKLRAAVETVNEKTDAQIEVTDIANGKLSDEEGAITDVTAALGDYVTQKLEQIKVDAQQENLTALYEQQADDISALAQAQQEYNEKWGDAEAVIESYMTTADGHIGMTREQAEAQYELAAANSEEAQAVSDAEAALESCNAAIENVSSSLGSSVAIADGAAYSIEDLAKASAGVSSAMTAVGGDIDDFSSDLADAGVSVETFSSLTDAQLATLVANWDGTTESILTALDGMGVELESDGVLLAQSLANGISTGEVDVEEATAILQSAASGDWASVIDQMSTAGVNIPTSVANGVTLNSAAATSATSAMVSALALTLTGGDATAAAELLGTNIDEGLANAILDGDEDAIEAAGGLSEDVIETFKDTFETHSPSAVLYEVGTDVDQGLADGISGNSSEPKSIAEALASEVSSAFDGLGEDLATTGSDASGGLASGLDSNCGSVRSVSSTLASMASSGVSDTPTTLQKTGSSASSSFATALKAAQSTAKSNAALMASAAAGMAAGDYYSSGSHLGQNFASGLRAAIGTVRSAASAVASALASVLSFSVPDEGPWSGSERGGERSGEHLAENFAQGMLNGVGDVRDAAVELAGAASLDAALGQGTSLSAASSQAVTSTATKDASSQPLTQGTGDELLGAIQDLLDEVRGLREDIPEDIANYTPTVSDREMRRIVQSYV